MDSSKYLIEPLQPKQLKEWARLMKNYFGEMNIIPEFHRFDQDVAAPLMMYTPPQAGVWLGHDMQNGKFIGLAALRPIAKRTSELKRLYVVPEARRQGWGQRLIKQAIEFAQQAEYMEILLAIRPDQKVALKLCEHSGFKPCARYNQDHRAGIFYSYKFSDDVK